jgi:ABC-type dipeptide/oligopeptide/nickel transport system permease component
MLRYIANRLLQLIPTIFGIYTLTFFLMRVLPGDPANFLVGARENQEALDNLRRVMHLNEPLVNQFVAFLGDALRGDLGRSYLSGQPVTALIGDAIGPTIALAASAMVIALVVGIPLGIFAAVRKNSIWDNFSRFIALLGVSIPVFWLGVQFQIIFGLQLRLLPVSGSGYDDHLILPAVTASLASLALLTRMTRSSVLEELGQDYVQTARGKGLPNQTVIWKHALRNALLPVVTVWGGSLANLLSGTLLVEVIFSWPGIGRLLVQSINTRDYPLVQGLVIVFALIYAGMNLLVDLSYPIIDPRIRFHA